MAGETSSTYMSLPVPGVGTTAGPAWATDIVNCLNLIDAHTHAAGSGTQITPAGLNINTDLSFASNSATSLKKNIFYFSKLGAYRNQLPFVRERKFVRQ